jgi:hypothetical protein
MTVLLRHDSIVFEDRTVYVSGNAYFDCSFTRCTMVVRESPCYLEKCVFEGCVWHIDMLIHDPEQVVGLMGLLENVRNSIPASEAKKQSPPTQTPGLVSSARTD